MTAPGVEEDLQEAEGGFSRRALRWIIGVGLASFAAMVLLSAFGKSLDPKPKPSAHTFSDSALGHRALAELLRSLGLGVYSRQAMMGGAGPTRPLVLAEPDLDWLRSNPSRLETLRNEAARQEAMLVLVLPKWKAGKPQKDKPEWLSGVSLLEPRAVRSVLGFLGDDVPEGLSLRRVSGDNLDCDGSGVRLQPAQVLAPHQALDPVLRCGGDSLIARLVLDEKNLIYVVSDPDLLNNQGLGQGRNAAVIHGFLTQGLRASGVVFDETIHGFQRNRGLLTEATRFPMSLAVIQGLLLFGLVLWAGMGRFGKPLPAASGLAAGKAILIDNTAKLLTNGGHAADSLVHYFRQTTREVAAHYFLPPDLPDSERLARLQRLSQARGHALSLAEMEQAIRQVPPGGRGAEQAARLARRLYDWRREMTNVH